MPADDEARRAEWSDTRWVPNAVVVPLGTNDWNLQKTQPLEQDEFVTKYVKFLRELILRNLETSNLVIWSTQEMWGMPHVHLMGALAWF